MPLKSQLYFFFQFPKLENSHAEPRSIVKGLFKIIGIIIGAALFVTGVCCVCCFCCPFCLCAKHRKGTVLRSGAEQIPPEQPQPQQQPLYHQPPVQPPPPQGENLYSCNYGLNSNFPPKLKWLFLKC